jgi:DNA-binding PadR family transcriptional regulator
VHVNSTSAVILGVLHDGPASGRQICEAAAIRLAAQGGVTRSQVYRELPALADAGLIRSGHNVALASRTYTVTAAGRRAFAGWAAALADGSDSVRSPVVLRVGFGAHLAPELRKRIIQDARTEHAQALAGHRRAAAKLKAAGDVYAAATTEFAIAYERALLRWLESVPTS